MSKALSFVARWSSGHEEDHGPGTPELLDAVESPGTVITPGRSRDLTPGAPSDPPHLPPAYRRRRTPDATRPERHKGGPPRWAALVGGACCAVAQGLTDSEVHVPAARHSAAGSGRRLLR